MELTATRANVTWDLLESTVVKVITEIYFKGRVDCFSMPVAMNKCFILNPGRKK